MAALLMVMAYAGGNLIYVASTNPTVKKMAFDPAREMNRRYGLGGKVNLTERSISFKHPDGSLSTAYFLGASDEKTVDRLRGTPNLIACFIDECGIYSSDTLKMMLEAVRPGLRPLAGKLILLGTPSTEGKRGTFYDATENEAYSQHRFDYRDNDRVPSFEDVEKLIDEDLRAGGYTRESAYFKREYLALFEVELEEKVYRCSGDIFYDGPPPDDLDTFLTGGDLGVSAEDALVTIGWRSRGGDGCVYVVDDRAASGQDSLAFANMSKEVNDTWHPVQVSVDPGGLGQKTIRTVQNLYPTIPIVEAVKPPVAIQVKTTNSMLQGGRLKIPRKSKLAEEITRPTWVNGIVGGKIDEHGTHSDRLPALRYACVAATPLLPVLRTAEAVEKSLQDLYLEQELRRAKASASDRQAAELGVNLTFEDQWSSTDW
jgi:Terminase RNaseH-like domain